MASEIKTAGEIDDNSVAKHIAGKFDVNKLVSSAAAQNAKYGAAPLLFWAAYGGHEKAIAALLKAGAKKDLKAKTNETPLQIAIRKERSDACIKLLGGVPKPKVAAPAAATKPAATVAKPVAAAPIKPIAAKPVTASKPAAAPLKPTTATPVKPAAAPLKPTTAMPVKPAAAPLKPTTATPVKPAAAPLKPTTATPVKPAPAAVVKPAAAPLKTVAAVKPGAAPIKPLLGKVL